MDSIRSGRRPVARRRRGARLPATLPLLALLAVAGGCGSGGAPPPAGRYRGTVLAEPLAKPDFTLRDTHDRSFDFRPRTHGELTLLYFGYTNCPDVCPVHMANLAAVLAEMPTDVVRRTRVVFVTVDPERDTPKRLRAWLDRFDPRFIGLRGGGAQVSRIEHALGVTTAVRDSAAAGPGPGSYAVGHAAQVIAFTPDDSAHVVYPFGTRQSDWAHDLPLLLHDFPGPASAPTDP